MTCTGTADPATTLLNFTCTIDEVLNVANQFWQLALISVATIALVMIALALWQRR